MITMSSAMSSSPQMRHFRRWIIAALCGLLGLTVGCSALRIGYGTAPDLVYWWVDRYVDFNDTQTPRVREAVAQWFAWHRRTQLPDYAALLTRAQAEVLADTTAARVCAWQTELIQRADTAFDRPRPRSRSASRRSRSQTSSAATPRPTPSSATTSCNRTLPSAPPPT
jgi:Family of unknown function (DUF6279)